MKKVDENVNICEGCQKDKEVRDIEGHILCNECIEDIVNCDFCGILIGINFDVLEDNFGRLSVPELRLPDKQTHLIFCNIDCLDAYLKKYRQELKERDMTCGC